MASNNFVFPPPPPPPPPRQTNSQPGGASWNAIPNRGGRGSYGRGRGQSERSQGDFRSTRGGSGHDNHNSSLRGSSRYDSGTRGGGGSSQFQRGQKRQHDQAFQRQGRYDAASSAPPPVPSFGFEMPPANPKPLHTVSASTGTAALQKKNALGLTPSFDEKSEHGDDDEEAKLAAQVSAGNNLQFTFRGQTASLSTPEDIALWIAERRKRFPTKAKAEAAKAKAQAEAEERAKRRAQATEERRQRMESNPGRGGRGGRQGRRDQQQPARGQSEAEKLQLELAEARKRIAELEKKASETAPSQPGSASAGPRGDDPVAEAKIQPALDIDEDNGISSGASDEETSSAGSSDESSEKEDDGPPVEESSRRHGPEKVPLPPRERKEQQVCREFARFGKCSRGARCYFKHEPGDSSRNSRGRNGRDNAAGRKSLYQKLSEQQQEISDELVLQHILYLGDKGHLAEADKD